MDALLDPLTREDISVRVLSVQKGKELESALEDGKAPRFAKGRANLTALSQLYNLYFVAYLDQIHVYQPQLQGYFNITPSLVLEPPLIRNLPGYMNTLRPHDINRITVGLLGNREMVIVACDDGDVVGYWTSQIVDKLDRHIDVDIAPAFRDNVEESAWGIAIHSRSRKIAISSNTHRLSIFSFGLVNTSSQDDPENDDSDNAAREQPEVVGRALPGRSGDGVQVLPDTDFNIPTVAFCNLPDDPEGRLVASGDINGVCIIWQLGSQEPHPSSISRAHFCPTHAQRPCRCYRDVRYYPHAIWGVEWLDSRAFRRTESCALNRGPYFLEPGRGVPNQSSTWRMAANSGNIRTSTMSVNSEPIASLRGLGLPNVISPVDRHRGPERFVVHQYPSKSETTEQDDRWLELDVPFFQMSSDQLVLQNICSTCPAKHELGGKAPLGQFLPDRADATNLDYALYHRENERLWSHAVIPELSVLLVATISGRCAIYSLLEGDDAAAGGQTHRHLRLDWIVPFRDQEENGDRPMACLRGMAVAPMDPTRKYHQWRLFLHYEDNTVFCYALSRDDYLSVAGKI
jgi:hypothetical protein